MMTAPVLSQGIPLSSILEGTVPVHAKHDYEITGITTDSRLVNVGDLFLACNCKYSNGVQYINEAVDAGACAVLMEACCKISKSVYKVPVYYIEDLHTRIGAIAARFYGQPASEMTVIGVTGTNGKTSVAYLLAQALSMGERNPAGFIGTLGYGSIHNLEPGLNTTPDPITLHRQLAGMKDQDINTVVMEVSSHGVDQYRIADIEFEIAILTNVSRDHLDYHGDIENYIKAKQQYFKDYSITKAVINLDDAVGRSIIDDLREDISIVAYALVTDWEKMPDINIPLIIAKIVDESLGSMTLELKSPWGAGCLKTRFTGRFNAYNLMACLASLCLFDIPFDVALERLSACKNIPGRMEFYSSGNEPQAIIDYAHTPDAFMQVLDTLKQQCVGKIYCVFGCGGDRDQGKRPQMGKIAYEYADVIVLTNDNPRNEDPDEIIKDILSGIKNHHEVIVESDRGKAIASAIKMAGSDDIVLIAGKGHEMYQEIRGIRHPFSDQKIVRQLFGESG